LANPIAGAEKAAWPEATEKSDNAAGTRISEVT
jgi:hypothetical protein